MDADAHRQRRALIGGEPHVQLGEARLHRERGADRVVRLPRVRIERAEEREDPVADELRDVPAVRADDAAHALEVLVQDRDEHGRVEAFTHRGEGLQVGEEDGDLLLLRVRRHALGDDLLDDLRGREARERVLQRLQLARRSFEPALELRDRATAAARERHQRRCEHGDDEPEHQQASSRTLRRPTAFASETTPTSSTISAGRMPTVTSRIRRWMSACW